MYKGKDWKYAYDSLNRMTDAVYDDASGGRNRYNETVSYNANGSALTIKRNGRNDAGNYTAIDNLTLGYRGNLLLKVTDKGDACTATGATDFNDGANINVEYTYDACGVRTSDANKGIAGIRYSYWGTPELIQFTNGSQTRYVYDASGVKQKRIHITAVDNIVVPLKTVMELSDDQILTSDTTEYLGNLVFENGRLDKVLFSSGYVSCNDNAANRFTFHYFVKDHLGNNRAVVNENGAIEQTTHYYPFGNSIADIGTNASIQQYKYNGKELDRMHGLDWYNYGARNYDPAILQWDRPDPLADKYYPVSLYVYCMDNSVNNIDPDGKEIINGFDITKANEKKATDVYINKVHDKNNTIIIFAHGGRNGMHIVHDSYDQIINTVSEFENFLGQYSDVWQKRYISGENISIVLFSCKTGINDGQGESFAKKVSDKFVNIPIIAPNDAISIYNDGSAAVDNDKTWNEFTNGEITNIYPGDVLPGTSDFEKLSIWEKLIPQFYIGGW